MYVMSTQRHRRSSQLGSWFTDVRNAAETAAAGYVTGLVPSQYAGQVASGLQNLIGGQGAPAPAAAPAAVPVSASLTPTAARVRTVTSPSSSLTVPLIAGGLALGGVVIFLIIKKKGRK